MSKIKKDSYYYYKIEEIFHSNNVDVQLIRFHDYEIGIHKHNFYELNVIVSGEGIHVIDGKEFTVKHGDVFVVPIEVEHAYVNTSHLSVVHLIFTEHFFERHNELFLRNHEYLTLFHLEPQLKKLYGVPASLHLSDEQLSKLETWFSDIVNYQKAESDLCVGLTDGLAVTVLYYLFSCFRELYSKNNLTSAGRPMMTGLVRYIFDSHHNVRIKQLAEFAGYSRSNFFRYFKRIMHETPGQFMMRCKIEAAKKMLCETDLPLTHISQECGFYDSPHFIRCFKKETGLSPKEYRRQFSAENR